MKSSWELHEGEEIAPGLLAMSRLGGGHAYEAYLAWSERLYCHVVVKIVRPDQTEDARTLRGLRREVEMLGRLDHPVVVRCFGSVVDGPRPHVVLEHLDGPRLSSLLRKHGPLPLEQLLPLALQICSALHYLSLQDVVHLDIKPSNIIMGSTPRLIDLSIARSTEAAARLDHVVGTDDFLSPEQCDPQGTGFPPAPRPTSGDWARPCSGPALASFPSTWWARHPTSAPRGGRSSPPHPLTCRGQSPTQSPSRCSPASNATRCRVRAPRSSPASSRCW